MIIIILFINKYFQLFKRYIHDILDTLFVIIILQVQFISNNGSNYLYRLLWMLVKVVLGHLEMCCFLLR